MTPDRRWDWRRIGHYKARAFELSGGHLMAPAVFLILIGRARRQ